VRENVPTLNLSTVVRHAQVQPKTQRSVAPDPVPLMVVTLPSVCGTNVARVVEVAVRSAHERAPTLHLNMVDFHVLYSVLLWNEENVKLNPVLDTPSLDPGQSAPSPAQVAPRREQGNVMHLDGLVLSIAHISDPLTKLANVKPNRVLSTVTGDRGHHGPFVPSRVVRDQRQRAECATLHHPSMEVSSVQDTTPSKLCVRSNPVPFMEGGRSGTNGEPVPRVVGAANKNEHVNAPILRPNMVEERVLVQLLNRERVTHSSVPSMVVGLHGECGGNVQKVVVGDALTDYDNVPNPPPSTVVNDVQVPPSKPNNVEQSSVRSMEVGARTLPSVLVPRPVEVERPPVTATATNLHPSTTDSLALEHHPNRRPATHITVLSTAHTLLGQSGRSAVTAVEVDNKPETASAHHPSTEVKDVRCSVMLQMNESATPSCVQ